MCLCVYHYPFLFCTPSLYVELCGDRRSWSWRWWRGVCMAGMAGTAWGHWGRWYAWAQWLWCPTTGTATLCSSQPCSWCSLSRPEWVPSSLRWDSTSFNNIWYEHSLWTVSLPWWVSRHLSNWNWLLSRAFSCPNLWSLCFYLLCLTLTCLLCCTKAVTVRLPIHLVRKSWLLVCLYIPNEPSNFGLTWLSLTPSGHALYFEK